MITPALAALILAAAPPAPPASDHEALLRLRAGDAACALLTPVERSFLDVVLDQARDDAIVAGADAAMLARYERATRAPACDDTGLHASADAHRARLATLAELTQPTLPGRLHAWAVRPPAAAGRPGWRVVQMPGGQSAAFGLYEERSARAPALALRADAPAPRAVMVMRDPARQAAPVDRTIGGLRPAPGGNPVGAWGAYAGGEQRFMANARLDPETAGHLAPAGGTPAYGFTFPDEALTALTALTPREGVRIDLLRLDGRATQSLWIEVGALRAGLLLASEADARAAAARAAALAASAPAAASPSR
ncbi:hypothetical protein L2D00_01880 [Hyphomonadaceae bacterium BL14]|nr:hypothetical protein L2D00_01880 [Hyphomonadaceae bacterium BL14]